ncbi:hypothetical protein F4Y93_05960 [Candidatus Poribacteria bacterium]|nr:hypothetical protein [Candidatus Poribacteria bacterium]
MSKSIEALTYKPDPIDIVYDFPEIRFKKTGLIYQRSITEKQKVFHACGDKFRAVQAMIGAGKSAMATIESFRHSWYYRSNFGFIIRKSIPQANISAIPDLMDVCPRWMIISWNKTDKCLELLNQYGYEFLKNGGASMRKGEQYDWLQELGGTSQIIFTSFEGTTDALEKWASSNLGWYFIDQAEQANEDIYVKLNERMRRMPSARQAWFIANFSRDIPQKTGWLWRFFSQSSPEHRENHWYTDDMPTDANKANLPPDYKATLKQTMHPEDYARLVSGDKSQMRMSKSVFPELSHDVHVLQAHKEPPAHWHRGIGLDPGLSNPTAFVEVAFSPNGDVYAYSEYEEKNRAVSDEALLLRNIITPQHIFYFMDGIDGLKRNKVTMTSLQAEYIAHGIPFQLAPREVLPGVQRIKEYLKFDEKRIHPFTGKQGAPRLLISPACVKLIEALLMYRFDERKTHTVLQNEPEKFRKYKDHLVDALRFILSGATLPLGANQAMPAYSAAGASRATEGPITQLQYDSQGQLDFSYVMRAAKAHVPSQPKQPTPSRPRQTSWSRGITANA